MSYNPSLSPFGVDASLRTRVSQITTQLDGKVLGADDTILFENNGTGTSTYANNKVNLAVTSGQFTVRQSKRTGNYYAGKSQLVECTFDNFPTQAILIVDGVTIGTFTPKNIATSDGLQINYSGNGFLIEANVTGTTWRLEFSGPGAVYIGELEFLRS